MAITFLDLIAVLLWPFVFSAAVWVIAVKALAETDEISKVVEALTRPNDVERNAKPKAAFLRDRSLGAITNRHRSRIEFHFKRTQRTATQHIKGERLSDEKNTSVRW